MSTPKPKRPAAPLRNRRVQRAARVKSTADERGVGPEDVELPDLTPAIAARTNELPEDFPGDPFDRTIVATAAILDLTLITTDPAIRDAGACAVEYYPFKPSQPPKRRR